MAGNDIQHPNRNLRSRSKRKPMKSMFRIAALAAGLAAASLSAARAADETQPAQPPAAPSDKTPNGAKLRHWQHDPMEQIRRLDEAVSLTPAQKDQINTLIKGNAPQRQAIKNDASLTPENRRAKMRELRNGTQGKIRALLTSEQQQKFDAMPRPEGGRGPRHGGPHNPPPSAGNPPLPDATPAAGSPPPPPNSL